MNVVNLQINSHFGLLAINASFSNHTSFIGYESCKLCFTGAAISIDWAWQDSGNKTQVLIFT